MKQIITKTINWHSIAEEGLPKVSGRYFTKTEYNSFENGNIYEFSVEPISVVTSFGMTIEVGEGEWVFDEEEPVKERKGNVFFWEDDDEYSYTRCDCFPVDGVTHYANTETDCMETVDFID
jgi:hypothetical protein